MELQCREGEDGPGGARRLFAVPLLAIMDEILSFNRWTACGVLMEGEEGYAAKGQEWWRGLWDLTAAVRK